MKEGRNWIIIHDADSLRQNVPSDYLVADGLPLTIHPPLSGFRYFGHP